MASKSVPNPPAISLRSVAIQGAHIRDEFRMVEPHASGDRWLIIDDEQVFDLEDLE